MTRFLFRPTIVLLLISAVFIFGARLVGQSFSYETLTYISPNNRDLTNDIRLYDLERGLSATAVPYIDFYDFSFSSDGRLAYRLLQNEDADIYILDTRSADTPIRLPNLAAVDRPLAWSPDGRYLAFSSYVSYQNVLLYVWDGENVINLTPASMSGTAVSYDPSWSLDGRLAFTVYYGFTPESAPSEIYLWDGDSTTNLSQTPFAGDVLPAWSADGRLAFMSGEGGEADILVWDGVSVAVAPELSKYYAAPTWTSDEQLAIVAQADQDSYTQIYVWDGQAATNISYDPTMHNGNPRWSDDGRWAFTTDSTSQRLLYVRDSENRVVFTTAGGYSPVWSPEGYLIFCKPSLRGWSLSVWNGVQTRSITQSGFIYAQTSDGSTVYCSSG
jgi:Tol biopolymer transport system component